MCGHRGRGGQRKAPGAVAWVPGEGGSIHCVDIVGEGEFQMCWECHQVCLDDQIGITSLSRSGASKGALTHLTVKATLLR